MEYSYEVGLDDMLIYQEQLFLSGKNPSIVDSIKRWEWMVLLALVFLFPLILYVAFSNIIFLLIGVVVGGIIFALFKRKSTAHYWACYKNKARKDALATYFNHDEHGKLTYKLMLFPDKLEITSHLAVSVYSKTDIDFKKITNNYIFFYAKKNNASYIPLKQLDDKESLVKWFSKIHGGKECVSF